ncbi:MAG TPA: FtsW/RodA/SpoVE family cell cycle protein [Actinomycetes bacterium]|nr:FtsW/RodA/SpoVE family cell cycle protein [Actinomycetes bacterium]
MSTTATATRTPPSAPPAGVGGAGRLAELVLLVLAVAVGAGAYAQVRLADTGRLPVGFWVWVAVGAAIALAAHVAVRLLAPYSDPVILPVVVALNGLGLALIYRLDIAAQDRATSRGGAPPTSYAEHQVVWTLLGVGLFVLVLLLVRELRVLSRLTYTAMLVGLVLLVLPLLPHVGVTINGARIWIRVGGLSFQPGEVAKLALIVFFAGYLVVKRDVLSLARSRVLGIDLPRGRDLGPIVVAWLASLAILVFQKDLGTSLLFFGLFVAMLYVATERVGWLVIGAVLFLLGSTAAYLLFAHVHDRVQVWLHPFADPNTKGYQIVQALYGLADGSILGSGIAQGHPDLVPFANSDFIVSTAGELLGLTGLMALITLYAILVERGLKAAVQVRDPFGRLLAFGLAFAVGLQVFVVVGGVTQLIPLTGLTTPFMSQGGSSLVANWVLAGLLLRVSDTARRPPPYVAPLEHVPPAPPPGVTAQPTPRDGGDPLVDTQVVGS